ncbi:hypothetical protein WA026_014417 [Henosepilachna vigintioctopunctata]|uniref:Malate dehydrogenase 1B n=1 Tax=Henosepilachna vigintioctopunctata TaxID=420089 RepID=A0AAW1UKN5_9CUCU
MPNFVIAGKADCPLYTHAIQIAKFLCEKLPEMTIKKFQYLGDDWHKFLLDINEANGWFITKSPVIWKEVAYVGSKPHLIGGLSEFWEYIDDYYGVRTFLDRDTVEELCLHNLKIFQDKTTFQESEETNGFIIGLFGFNNQLAQLILPELLTVPGLFSDELTVVKIHDPEALEDADVEEEIKEVISDYQTDLSATVNFQFVYTPNLTEFIEGTDLMLITEDFCQRHSEEKMDWLKRCDIQMFYLCYEINDVGKQDLRIVFCHLGPICFIATSFAKHCNNKRDRNIVAVTAHEGLKALTSVSKLTGIPVSNLGAPPVWGFVGLDHFIDVQATVVLQDIIRPYRRSLKNIVGSTLPQKVVKKNLRLLSCSIDKNIFEDEFNDRCFKYKKLDRQALLPILRATSNLLELWYSGKKNSDQIISLGIIGDGVFGIPQKVVFSQPAVLDKEGHWITYENLPILDNSKSDIENCITYTEKLLDMMIE